MARTMAAIAGCRIARVRRFKGTSLGAEVLPDEAKFLRYPFLARIAGLHGGQAFEKIESAGQLQAFVHRTPEVDYYLMDYLDYRSPDGFFRKYRFFYIGGAILPYHLAIATQWKAHHFRTDMEHHAWMQQEEEAFLVSPQTFFSPEQIGVLCAVGAASGLDFVGIDCGLDQAGNVVLFEINAAMLVSGNNHAFPYKTPAVRKVKDAFDAMLKQKAHGSRG